MKRNKKKYRKYLNLFLTSYFLPKNLALIAVNGGTQVLRLYLQPKGKRYLRFPLGFRFSKV